MKEQILKILENLGARWKQRKLREHPDMLEFLDSLYPDLPLNQQIYLIERNLTQPPVCENCGKAVFFHSEKKGYYPTCSKSCMNENWKTNGKMAISRQKSRETNTIRYGADNPMKNRDIQIKAENTNLKKYGSKTGLLHSPEGIAKANYLKGTQEFKDKVKKTVQIRYGVDYISQHPDIKDKVKGTLYKNYGTVNISNIDHVSKARNERIFNKFEELALKFITIMGKIPQSDEHKNVYKTAHPNVKFICHRCNKLQLVNYETFRYRIREFINPCECAGYNIPGTSIGQLQITQYIKDLGFDVLENNRLVIPPKELDIVIPEKKIAIEYHGLYYHSENEEIYSVNKRHNDNYHFNKLNLANQAGYRLIQIFEDEWLHKSDIVKNKLAHILGVNNTKIYARNCIVKELTMEEARDFINLHHIQGYHGSRYRYGLYHNNELVSVITFALPNKAKGGKLDGTIELDRYCSSILVVGGASKLLNYFCKSHPEWKTIFSYADRRWSEGNLYIKMGFTLEHITAINYWYVKGNKRIHRFALRKNQDDDQELTEIQNRLLEGYRILWDCGNFKFKYYNPY